MRGACAWEGPRPVFFVWLGMLASTIWSYDAITSNGRTFLSFTLPSSTSTLLLCLIHPYGGP
eukprot:scaffold170941_cov39-Tisochrysis_lutea.AAC.1